MTAQRVLLYVMSGTGNTHRVARWMEAEARARGLAAELRPIRSHDFAADQPGRPGTLIGLLMPTHAFTAPWPAIRLALRMPRSTGAQAFVVATRGGTRLGARHFPGLEGTAGYLIAILLALKGYSVRGVLGLDMPANWIAAHPGFTRDAADSIISRAAPRASAFLGQLLDGRRRFGGWVPLALGLALIPVSVGYLLKGRFLLAKVFFADSRCTGCGQCARSCPHGAIRMIRLRAARPYWLYSCESCMRCMAYCPVRAVQAGHSWAVLLAWLCSLPVLTWLLPGLAPDSAWAAALRQPAVRRAVDYLASLAIIFAAYGIFHFAVRIPWINMLFAWTTLTRRFRRYHEPSTSLADLQATEKPG